MMYTKIKYSFPAVCQSPRLRPPKYAECLARHLVSIPKSRYSSNFPFVTHDNPSTWRCFGNWFRPVVTVAVTLRSYSPPDTVISVVSVTTASDLSLVPEDTDT